METGGTRVWDKEPHELLPGEYGRCGAAGDWYGVPPGTDLIANLSAHDITLHDDGSITVSPSILVKDKESSWHGYLKRGVWEVC